MKSSINAKVVKPITNEQKKLLNNARNEILSTDFSSFTTLYGFYMGKDSLEFKPAPKPVANVADALTNWTQSSHGSLNKFEFFEKSFKAAVKQNSFFTSKENKVRYQNWSNLEKYNESKDFLTRLKDDINQLKNVGHVSTPAIEKIMEVIHSAESLALAYQEAANQISNMMTIERERLMGISYDERTHILSNPFKSAKFYNQYLDNVPVNRLSCINN